MSDDIDSFYMDLSPVKVLINWIKKYSKLGDEFYSKIHPKMFKIRGLKDDDCENIE